MTRQRQRAADEIAVEREHARGARELGELREFGSLYALKGAMPIVGPRQAA